MSMGAVQIEGRKEKKEIQKDWWEEEEEGREKER